MFFRKSRLIQKLYAEIQHLRELLARTEGERDSFREMAGRAIGLLDERGNDVEHSQNLVGRSTWGPLDEKYRESHLPNYQAPIEKHCPECCVSVRAESWPAECPNCHCMFGFGESENEY